MPRLGFALQSEFNPSFPILGIIWPGICQCQKILIPDSASRPVFVLLEGHSSASQPRHMYGLAISLPILFLGRLFLSSRPSHAESTSTQAHSLHRCPNESHPIPSFLSRESDEGGQANSHAHPTLHAAPEHQVLAPFSTLPTFTSGKQLAASLAVFATAFGMTAGVRYSQWALSHAAQSYQSGHPGQDNLSPSQSRNPATTVVRH